MFKVVDTNERRVASARLILGLANGASDTPKPGPTEQVPATPSENYPEVCAVETRLMPRKVLTKVERLLHL